jgi:HEAT repeat protein
MISLMFALALLGQDDKAVEEALEAFKGAIKSNSEAERCTAVVELAKVQHPKTLSRLSPFLTSDGTTVRIAAAKGLAAFVDHKKQAVTALVNALGGPNVKEFDVQVAILDSIGKLGDASALPALHRLFDEKEAKVAKAAVVAAGAIGSAGSVDPLIELLKKLEKVLKADTSGAVGYSTPNGYTVPAGAEEQNRKRATELKPVVDKALQDITKERQGTAQDWATWWAKARASFKASK